MAVTYLEEKKQTQQPQQVQQAQTASAMKGVSQNTQQNLSRYQNGYQPSERVSQAQQMLQQNQSLKPKGYNSKYADQLDAILEKIQNPQGFKYSFNGDALFQQAADMMTQKGKQAAMNVAGQAAGLTGGYGNSYATQAASQAYQQSLMDLYANALGYYDRAYQAHRDQLGDQKDAYSMLAAREAQDYDRYRDTYKDWQDERDYLTGREDTERSFDVNQFNADRSYWTDQAKQENADYWQGQEFDESKRRYDQDFEETKRKYEQDFAESKRRDNRDYEENVRQYEKNFAENQRQFDAQQAAQTRQFEENKRQFDAEIAEKQRQFNESLDWDKMSEAQKYAAEYCRQILAQGNMPSEDLLKAAGLSSADAQAMMTPAQVVVSGGGGGGTGGSKTYYVDKNGVFYTYDNKGNPVYVDKSKIKDADKINTSENTGTKGTSAFFNTGAGIVGNVMDAIKKNKKK